MLTQLSETIKNLRSLHAVQSFNRYIFMHFKDIYEKTSNTILELPITSQILLIIIIITVFLLSIIYIKILGLPYDLNKLVALNNAVTNNDTYTALTLLDPALINISCDSDGFTPFLKACWNGNTVLVKAMLRMGANPEIKTTRHENAFFLAAFHCIRNITSKDATCIHTLFNVGVDIDVPNMNGLTAVQMAAMYGHTQLVYWLIRKGADIYREPTPLHLAQYHGYGDVACLFDRRTKTRTNGRLRPLI